MFHFKTSAHLTKKPPALLSVDPSGHPLSSCLCHLRRGTILLHLQRSTRDTLEIKTPALVSHYHLWQRFSNSGASKKTLGESVQSVSSQAHPLSF